MYINTIQVSIGRTISLGQYESARYDVQLVAKVDAGEGIRFHHEDLVLIARAQLAAQMALDIDETLAAYPVSHRSTETSITAHVPQLNHIKQLDNQLYLRLITPLLDKAAKLARENANEKEKDTRMVK